MVLLVETIFGLQKLSVCRTSGTSGSTVAILCKFCPLLADLPPCTCYVVTEEKAKVVAAVWGTKGIKFLAALAILPWDDFEE